VPPSTLPTPIATEEEEEEGERSAGVRNPDQSFTGER